MGRQPASTKIGEKKITRIRVRGGNFKFRALRLDHGNYSWAGEAVTRKTRILKVVYNSTNNELVRTNTLVKGSIIQIDSTPFKAWYLQYYNIDLSNKQEIQAAVDKKLLKEKDAKDEADKGKKGGKKEEKGQAKKEEPKAKTGTEEKPEKGKKEEKSKAEPKKQTEKGKKEEKPKATAETSKPKAKETTTTTSTKGKTTSTKAKSKTTEVTRKVYSKSALKKFDKRNSQRVLEPGLGDQFKTGRLYAKITSRPGQSGRCDGYILESDELAFYLKKMNLKKKK